MGLPDMGQDLDPTPLILHIQQRPGGVFHRLKMTLLLLPSHLSSTHVVCFVLSPPERELHGKQGRFQPYVPVIPWPFCCYAVFQFFICI